MKKFIYGTIVLAIIFGFNGCTTTAKQQYVYVEPNMQNTDKQKLLIHKSKCLAKTSQSVQVPIQMPCFGKGFSKGYCEGQKSKEMEEYRTIKDEIMEGCMAEYGYIKTIQQ